MAISTDAHTINQMNYLKFEIDVAWAPHGWLEKRCC